MIQEASSLVTVASLFTQKTYLATFLEFLPQTMQPRNSGQMCKIKETTNLTRNADLYTSEKLYYFNKRGKHLNNTLFQVVSTL